MWVKKNPIQIFWIKKKFGLEILSGKNKLWLKLSLGPKNLGHNKIRSEICFGQIWFWSYMICLFCATDYCWLEQQQHRVCLSWCWVGFWQYLILPFTIFHFARLPLCLSSTLVLFGMVWMADSILSRMGGVTGWAGWLSGLEE